MRFEALRFYWVRAVSIWCELVDFGGEKYHGLQFVSASQCLDFLEVKLDRTGDFCDIVEGQIKLDYYAIVIFTGESVIGQLTYLTGVSRRL